MKQKASITSNSHDQTRTLPKKEMEAFKAGILNLGWMRIVDTTKKKSKQEHFILFIGWSCATLFQTLHNRLHTLKMRSIRPLKQQLMADGRNKLLIRHDLPWALLRNPSNWVTASAFLFIAIEVRLQLIVPIATPKASCARLCCRFWNLRKQASMAKLELVSSLKMNAMDKKFDEHPRYYASNARLI